MPVIRVEVAQFDQLFPIENGQFAVAEFHRPGAAERLDGAVHDDDRHARRFAACIGFAECSAVNVSAR
jgi:hypothetical protein